jgi:hypothetical protein
MFKEIGYEDLILGNIAIAGRPYKSEYVRPGHHQPIGTQSQTVPYFLNGQLIAVCHRYLLPDGSLGASGKPDPKMLEYRNQRLQCHSKVKGLPHPCPVCSSDPEDWRVVMSGLLGVTL